MNRPKRKCATEATQRIKEQMMWLTSKSSSSLPPVKLSDKKYMEECKKQQESSKGLGYHPVGSGYHYDRKYDGSDYIVGEDFDEEYG
jgi:hypothetical protein